MQIKPQSGQPLPKPNRKREKARKAREDAQQLKAFRDAVWLREQVRLMGRSRNLIPDGFARCQYCDLCVFRTRRPYGEVHHRIGRRNKATRYDPNNGVLLCRECHRAVTEHRIEV